MKKEYLSSALVFGLSALLYATSGLPINAETAQVQSNDAIRARIIDGVEVKTKVDSSVMMDLRDDDDDNDDDDDSMRMSVEMKNSLEVRKDLLEEQREKFIQAAEARKKALEAKKDTAGAMREEMKIKIEEKRAEMDEKREALKEEFEAKRASSTARRIEWQQDVAVRKAEHVAKVITATIERLEKIIVRIESRITKVQGQGGDTTEAEGFVAAAKVNLSDAKASVAAFAALDLTSDKAQENFEKVRTLAAEAREHIRKAHENMMLAVRSLGAVDKEALPTVTATTTTTTTVNTQ